MTVRVLLILVTLALVPSGSYAYDQTTHEDMSEAAAFSSVLAKPETLSALGLTGGIDDPQLTFPNSEGKEKAIKFLIRDGARFEDTFPRSLNHFYDPLRRTGLLFGVYIGNPSPDWALEDTTTNIRQAYSLRDARDSLYKALTASKQSDRDANVGLTFQTLGQVIHHLQDMAQPQHVRNDMHLDQWELGGLNRFYNPSLYEKHTQGLGGNLPFSGYPPVTFTKARDYWTGGINGNGKGIADFTNANFLSAGTNFRGTTAPLPNENYPAPRWNGPMVFYGTDVFDAHTGLSDSNQRAATRSIFDQDLEKNTLPRAFALNRFNFKAAVSDQGSPT